MQKRKQNKINQAMKTRIVIFFVLTILSAADLSAQKNKWKDGILVDEFIYTEAPFPEAHAATIAETPGGLIAAWLVVQKKEIKMYVSGQASL